jgi:release factor glutamine methyltransferase
VSVAKELPEVRIFATDRSEKALSVARRNAQHHDVSGRIRFLEGDLFAPLEELDLRGRVDIITANPPYVKSGDLPLLQPEVRDYEPGIALVAGPAGTEIAERIIAAAPEYLKSGGSLIMEMGMDQAEYIVAMVGRTKAYAEPCAPEGPGGDRPGGGCKKAMSQQTIGRQTESRLSSVL